MKGQDRIIEIDRKTKETDIKLLLNLSGGGPEILTDLPFMDHLLTALSFHGGFGLSIKAKGDLAVDQHHLTEDLGIALGEALSRVVPVYGAIARFGHSVIPMDEALSEAVLDICGRPTLVYVADYPQEYCGSFPIALLREFFLGLSSKAAGSFHLICRGGVNSHHMAESLFKALGKAIGQAYAPAKDRSYIASTKGMI